MADERNKKVLMIAYEYPPVQAGGVCRTLKFSRYLDQFGWSPHVLTVSNPTGPCDADPVRAEASHAAKIYRTPSFELDHAVGFLSRLLGRLAFNRQRWTGALQWRLGRFWNLFSAPDPMVYWALPAIPKGLQIIYRKRIDALYSTSWPYSDHLAALILHRLTGKPWIADFRDPFTRHYNYGAASARKDRFNHWLEAAICRHARFVINPTQRATDRMRKDHPELPADRFVTVRNGFDENEFANPPAPSRDFELLHAGSFYLSRRPDLILDAVEVFLERCPDARPVTRVTFLGKAPNASGNHPFVTLRGWCSRAESTQAIGRAPILLLVRHPECSLTIPGKLYEYMASGNHILALTSHQPELVELLRRYGNASILPSPSVDQLADQLEILFQRHQSGQLQSLPMTSFVSGFSRQRQTGQLAQLLTAAVDDLRAPQPASQPSRKANLATTSCEARVA